MTSLTLKLKTKDGQHVIKTEPDYTLATLKSKIGEVTGLPTVNMLLKVGFPPRLVECVDEGCNLEAAGIKNGDILIVEERPISEEERNAAEAAERLAQDERLAEELAHMNSEGSGILLKQVVPADNSCLFTSVNFVMTGKVDLNAGGFLRQVIASEVNNDKVTYNEGILGRPNDEYCAWIMQEDSWGGAIEVAILSKYYGVEFDVVDITNAMIARFGEDQNYGMRGFLLFDGIHYDPLFLESLSVSG